MTKLIESELDGKKIAYCSETIFLVQISKGKGSYKTKARFIGNLFGAVMHFNGINIRAPFNKRLLMPSCSKKPILARVMGT